MTSGCTGNDDRAPPAMSWAGSGTRPLYSPDVAPAAAVLVCCVLGALCVFQVALAAGAPLGRFAWGGRHEVLPRGLRFASLSSLAVYVLIGAVVLARADLVSVGLADGTVRTGAWVVTGYFLVGIGVNLASRSRPERLLMSPVAAALCLLCAVVALT